MEQEDKGKGAEAVINNGEISVHEPQKRKHQAESESLTGTAIHPEDTQKEIVVEDTLFQTTVDHVTLTGLPHS